MLPISQRLMVSQGEPRLTFTMLSQFDYTYNAVGDILSWTQANSGQSGPQHYDLGYDRTDQLTAAELKDATNALLKQYGYHYDPAGNRDVEQRDNLVISGMQNNVNQLVSRTGGGLMTVEGTVNETAKVVVGGTTALVSGTTFKATIAVTTGTNSIAITATDGSGNTTSKTAKVVVIGIPTQMFSYDDNGNMASDGEGRTFEWDAANRLSAIISGSNRSEFTYNGLNQRVRIIEKTGTNVTSTKHFVWYPGDPQPAEERDGNNSLTKRYFAEGFQAISYQPSATNSYFYSHDHLGSVREMTDNSGSVRARYAYDPYGKRSKLNGDLEADFGFTGHYYHQASQFSLTLHRVYDPDLGRWLSRDKGRQEGSSNVYMYVLNDPVGFMDVEGLKAHECCDQKTRDAGEDKLRQAYAEAHAQIASTGVKPHGDPTSPTASCYAVNRLALGLLKTPPKCWSCRLEHWRTAKGRLRKPSIDENFVVCWSTKQDGSTAKEIAFDCYEDVSGVDADSYRSRWGIPDEQQDFQTSVGEPCR